MPSPFVGQILRQTDRQQFELTECCFLLSAARMRVLTNSRGQMISHEREPAIPPANSYNKEKNLLLEKYEFPIFDLSDISLENKSWLFIFPKAFLKTGELSSGFYCVIFDILLIISFIFNFNSVLIIEAKIILEMLASNFSVPPFFCQI
jgi:hypothetical protein